MTEHRSISPEPAEAHPRALSDTALVPVRERHDGWTPQRQRQFIETLADTACVTTAANAAGMSAHSAWRLRRRPDARAFDAAWEAALERGFQRLVSVALDRAINGSIRQRWYHGEMVAEERVHHDSLLLALIHRTDGMLGHDRARRALREDWEGGMAALEAGARDAADLTGQRYEVWSEGFGLLTNCPPGPDFCGMEVGRRGTPDYRRSLSQEEELAYVARRTDEDEGGIDTEAARRALFGLPKPARAWRPSRKTARRKA